MAKKNNIDDLLKKHLEQQKLIENAEESISNLLKLYASIADQIKEINYLKEKGTELEDKIKDSSDEISKLYKDRKKATDAERVAIDKLIAKEKERLNKLNDAKDLNDKLIEQGEEQIRNEQEAANAADGRLSVIKSIGKASSKLISIGKQNLNYYYKQDKAIKNVQLSMGIISKQSLSFGTNISRAASKTNALGSNVEDLAAMQGTFSSELGLAVQLTEDGFYAMSKLAEGTGLGNEEAASLAASMNRFNISAEDSANIIEGVLKDSKKLGVNGLKVTKSVSKNLKLANKYGFKNGIKGLAKLTAEAERLGVELEAIAGVAEQLFTPEGAIDMAAKLQVLGGEWSKIADPFKLMYQARNDMEGLTKSIAGAAKNSFKLNAATGEFEASAMEMHRLREVAKATNMQYDDLAEAAKRAAKITSVEREIGMSIDPEYRDFLSSVAQYSKTKKGFVVNIEGEPKLLKDLAKDNKLLEKQIKALKESNVKLEENAKAAKTFDETWENFKNSMKTLLLPAFQGFTQALTNIVQGFDEYLIQSGFKDGIIDLSKALGKWFIDNPIAPALAMITAGIASKAQWITNGMLLAKGFNSMASVNGGGDGSGMLDGLFGKKKGKFSKAMKKGGYTRNAAGRIVKSPRGLGRIGRLGGKLGAGLGIGALGMGLDIGRDFMDAPNSGAGKAMGIGAKMLEGAGMGAMAGPWGALIGALGGLGYGIYDEFIDTPEPKKIHQDFVMRPGQPAAAFTEKDTLIGLKDGGPIEKSFSKMDNGGTPSKVEFGDMNINFGTIRIEGDYGSNSIDLANDPKFLRELTKNIQDTVRQNIGGGKSNPNPVV